MPRPRKARPPLTKRAIDAARPSSSDQFLWDGLEHGLGLKITPTGSRVFVLQKSVRGRLRRITLGPFGDLTLEAARVQARRFNGDIAVGRDPIEEQREARAARERAAKLDHSVSQLWQRYKTEVVSVENRPATAAKKTRMWAKRVEPAIGQMRIKDVTQEHVSDIVRSPLVLRDGQVIRGRAEAGNLYRLLHHLFRKALLWGLRPRELGNPLEGVSEPKVARRERLLTTKEVGALFEESDRSLVSGEESPCVVGVIKAAALTGARISELLTLRWTNVRRDELELELPDTKTGFSRRPISADALSIFDSIQHDGGAYVFPNVPGGDAPLGYDAVQKAFKRITARAGVPNCTLHTLRHWFSTATANLVSNPRVGMVLTGHKSLAAYMAYVHRDKDQARELAAEIARLTRAVAVSGTVRSSEDERMNETES